jgi:hypothetical protein
MEAKTVNQFKYSLTHSKHSGSVAIVYFGLDKKLVKLEFNIEASERFKIGVGKFLPVNSELLPKLKEKGLSITDISQLDLSFQNFWDSYKNKVGKKARVQNKFEQLSKEDKVLAFAGIRKIRRYYTEKNIQLPYPESYINGRLWENEFEI